MGIPHRAGRSRPRPPWQVRAAVLLIAGWWVGNWVGLPLIEHSGGGESPGAYVGLGIWTLVIALLLRNTWRGGGATWFVAGAALLCSICAEVVWGLITLLMLLDGVTPLFLDDFLGVFMMVIGACPLTAWRLLRQPAAQAYARPRSASVAGTGEADPAGP